MLLSNIPRWTIVLLFVSFFCSLAYFFSLPWMPYPYAFLPKGLSVFILSILALNHCQKPTRFFLFLALVFSTAGDVFLALPDEKFFLCGLASFFVAHVFYILTFLTLIRRPLFLDPFQKNFLLLFPLFPLIMFLILKPHLNDLTLAVFVYEVIVTCMCLCSALIKSEKKFLLGGSLLFVLSDSVLAFSKFVFPFWPSQQLVWVLYYFAQLYLLLGCVKLSFEKNFLDSRHPAA